MNKKGFIATSLIYSFFLIFCALLVGFISLSAHNKNLLNKSNDNIRNDLIGRVLSNASYGTYIKIDVNHPEYNLNNVNWILYNTNNNESLLVSDSIVLSYDDSVTDSISKANNEINSFIGSCINDIYILNYSDFNLFRNNINDKEILEKLVKVEPDYLVINNNMGYKYTYNGNIDLSLNDYKNNVLNSNNLKIFSNGDRINIRLVIKVSSDKKLSGGTGSVFNPYNLRCV